nr:hypothetical protein [Caldilineaceae bacterium]
MPVDTSERGTYQRLLDEKYAELEQILADLPAPALLWQPFANSPWQGPSNPLGAIVAHAVSSTVYLLHQAEYAAGKRQWQEVTGDEGREEFGPANHDPAYLLARVRRTQEYA